MSAGDIGTWVQAVAAVTALFLGIATCVLGALWREIKDSRKESEEGRNRLHERLDNLPLSNVTRREYEANIKGLEANNNTLTHAIDKLTQTVSHLSDQLDKMQSEIASCRIELMQHLIDHHGKPS